MNLLYLGSHSVLEFDQVRMWSRLGIDVFSIGAYTNPHEPEGSLRPAIPEATDHPDLRGFVHDKRVEHLAHDAGYPVIDWAKYDLHPEIVAWADTVLVDCYPESWIPANWERLRGKRVIWRTIGQSGPQTEQRMALYRSQGLEIVRYSPREKFAFERAGAFAGEDTIIRFSKDPADWGGWIGDNLVVGNLAQHDTVPHGRDDFLSWPYLTEVTEGLDLVFGGPNSEKVGGLGALTYTQMQNFLCHLRAFVCTGTAPASYTLGLMEAMMTGTPTIAMPLGMGWTSANQLFFDLYEASDIVDQGIIATIDVRRFLRRLIEDPREAAAVSYAGRARAIDLFSEDKIREQWAAYLGVRVEVAA